MLNFNFFGFFYSTHQNIFLFCNMSSITHKIDKVAFCIFTQVIYKNIELEYWISFELVSRLISSY